MAFSSLFTLIDDIASILDDVALMTKIAAKKTVGVVGDDLALNANQVTGASSERELPIVWAVTKGSLVNKVILIPIALLLSAFLPWLIVPLLMIGGAYLCFEGVEKILHKFIAHEEHEEKTTFNEAAKIKGAIRTDFILSAEINAILVIMPKFMRSLSFIGTLAMFLVGGGIFVHNVDFIHHLLADYQLADGLLGNVATLVVGVIVGAIACAIVLPAMKLFGKH